MNYAAFLEKKRVSDISCGFKIEDPRLKWNKVLKDFQVALVKWALAKGRSAIFADTGLGKTGMQSTWAYHVAKETKGKVIIVAPLAVAKQTVEEAADFGIEVKYTRDMPAGNGVFITNYEMIDHFDLAEFSGVVLDESSILKSQDGETRNKLISLCQQVPYRLSCTATPSPNDYMELGNQSEFLGVMSQSEMLAMFFTHDGGETSKWRLKGHGQRKFWEWMATWAAVIRKPSDIGFSDDGYILPSLNYFEHVIEQKKPLEGNLFVVPAQTLQERRKAKRESLDERCLLAAELVKNSDEEWIIWCHLNDEQDLLNKLIGGSLASVQGSDSIEDKEDRLLGFAHGKYKNLLSKPSIAGFGMNYQHARNMVFVGLDDSFEKFYQAVRREYRFGQTREVNVHIVTSESEGAIKQNIERKQSQHDALSEEMVIHMRELMKKYIIGTKVEKTDYNANKRMEIPTWLK